MNLLDARQIIVHHGGMASDKPTVSVRLPEDLLAFVDRLAAEQDRSRNWVITDLVRKASNVTDLFPPFDVES